MVVRSAIAFLLILAACHNGDSPTDPRSSSSQEHGRLSGVVTIGPNCPGPTTTQPCPTPPGAYAERKILVFNEAGSTPIATVDIDSQGLYLIDLVPAVYTVDLRGVGIDKTSDLPKTVAIRANAVTVLNVSIDTGLR